MLCKNSDCLRKKHPWGLCGGERAPCVVATSANSAAASANLICRYITIIMPIMLGRLRWSVSGIHSPSKKTGGRVIIAHLGRRLRGSGSVIDLSQLPSPSPSGSYHLDHSDSALTIRVKNRAMCQIIEFWHALVKGARVACMASQMVYLCAIWHISCKLAISHIVAEESTTFLR